MNKYSKIIIRTVSILLILMIAVSCDGSMSKMEPGKNIHELIYPYLRFEKAGDGTSASASVMAGAGVEVLEVPGYVRVEGDNLPVKEFKGFENPEDSKTLKEVILPETMERVDEHAFDMAEKLETVTTRTASGKALWANLPELQKEGYEFLGWYAGDTLVTEGMTVDPEYPKAEPRWRAHSFIKHEGKEPTCTEVGWKPYITCGTCDYSTYEEIPALGHAYVHVERKEPTCTESGNMEHWKCSRCGKLFSSENPEDEIDSAVIPAKGHEYIHYAAKAPTCTGIGYREHWKCPVCGRYFTEKDGVKTETPFSEIRIEPSEHTYEGEWTFDSEKHWHECSVCGERTDVELHVWENPEVITAPTETTPGKVRYTCKCGAVKTETVEPENHNFVKIEESRKEPTCTENGWQDWICLDCSLTYREILPALGHSPEKIMREEPTCQKEGVMEHWFCERCGGHFSSRDCSEESRLEKEEYILPIVEHKFDGTISFNDEGHWHMCSFGCGTEGPLVPHEFREVVDVNFLKSSATCTSPAVYWKSCECGYRSKSETFEYGEPKGHDLVHHPASERPCEEGGNIEYWSCSVCGEKFVYDEEGNLKPIENIRGEHTFGGYETDGTHHQKICAVCGKVYGEAELHSWQQNHDEYRHWDECTVCGDRKNVEDHTWITVGDHTYCSGCGAEMGSHIDQGGFDVEEEITVPSGKLTYTENDGTYTFSFVNGNAKYPPQKIMWYVNDEEQSETGNTFTLVADSPRSYTVMCVFMNEGGVGSASETITGRNL